MRTIKTTAYAIALIPTMVMSGCAMRLPGQTPAPVHTVVQEVDDPSDQVTVTASPTQTETLATPEDDPFSTDDGEPVAGLGSQNTQAPSPAPSTIPVTPPASGPDAPLPTQTVTVTKAPDTPRASQGGAPDRNVRITYEAEWRGKGPGIANITYKTPTGIRVVCGRR